MAAENSPSALVDAPGHALSVHVSNDGVVPTVVVAGDLVAPDAHRLSWVVDEVLSGESGLVLDLTAMTAVDLAGVTVLRAVADSAARSHRTLVARFTGDSRELADDAGALAALGDGVRREVVA